jgi:PAS domain S-box-containing protein
MGFVSRLDPKLFSTAFDCMDVGMLIHDENKTILEVNRAMVEITGFSRVEMIGQNCSSLFTKTFCESSCKLCESVDKIRNISNFETPITRKNGRTSWIRLDAVRFYDRDSFYSLVTFKDVTEIHTLEKQVVHPENHPDIIGKSKALLGAFEFVRSMAKSDIPLLIVGATGTGKELAASAIHHHGSNRNGPFVKVNCAALSEHLMESELFGHVKGAFTGAARDRIGRFEAASRGTIFLDEIGEVSMQFQAKLLRVLQEKEIERVGDQRPRKVDVRVVAATSKDLIEEIRVGRFREDLYYRLAGGVVNMPLLKERKEDIPILASHFVSKFSAKYDKKIAGISTDLMNAMMSYHWPGNIRELYNLIENAVVICKANVIDMEGVPSGYFKRRIEDCGDTSVKASDGQSEIPPSYSEKERIQAALEANRYKISASAKTLGISRVTLWRKMKTLDVR